MLSLLSLPRKAVDCGVGVDDVVLLSYHPRNMVSWRVTFSIGSAHPLQAVPFSDFWADLQQDTAFIGCQISLQRCNPFQRKRASFCRGSFICTVHLLPNVHMEKNCFSENERPASTMHQAFCNAQKKCCKSSLNPVSQVMFAEV